MAADGVKVEDFDGTYACVVCSESVRGGDALHCAQCSSNPVHVSCVRGSPFAETCAQCSGKTMQPWTGRVGGAANSAAIDLVAAGGMCTVCGEDAEDRAYPTICAECAGDGGALERVLEALLQHHPAGSPAG